MRAFVLAGVVALTFAPRASPQGADRKQVEDALHAGCAAFERGDVAAVEAFLGDGFTLTNGSGDVTTREQTLDEVRKREPRYEVFRNSRHAGPPVRRHGARPRHHDREGHVGRQAVRGGAGVHGHAPEARRPLGHRREPRVAGAVASSSALRRRRAEDARAGRAP